MFLTSENLFFWFFSLVGFPELVRIFELRGVDGMALSALTELSLEEELALTNKSLQELNKK